MLKALKKKEYGLIPTKKALMLQAYLQWKDRGASLFGDQVAVGGTVAVEVDDDYGLTTEGKAVTDKHSLIKSEVV